MIIHATLNNRPNPAGGQKPIKVEFIYNHGYWSKWYLAYDRDHAEQMMNAEYSDAEYKRAKYI